VLTVLYAHTCIVVRRWWLWRYWQCAHTCTIVCVSAHYFAICVSAYYFINVLPRILLGALIHTIYVSACYYVCVRILRCCMCVRRLLYKCPSSHTTRGSHTCTTICVSAYYFAIYVSAYSLINILACIHVLMYYYICVRILHRSWRSLTNACILAPPRG
jgi:hypothetical protein